MPGFAPAAPPLAPEAVRALTALLGQVRRLLVVTGAGCSTESGIPDYRSPSGSLSQGHKPTTYQEFVKSPEKRQRYWARAYLGWDRFAQAKPNAIHFALAELEARGRVHHMLTQNVDGLHTAAGSRAVTELHGNARSVVCLQCGAVSPRTELQHRMAAANPRWVGHELRDWAQMRPDGDAESSLDPQLFAVPDCTACGGVLKPHVVMFGESIPKHVVQCGYEQLDQSDLLLALGTSLQVPSIFRYIRHAHANKVPIVIANVGPTRGDDLACLKVEARCGEVAAHLRSCA
eukprot:EG_transcript_17989